MTKELEKAFDIKRNAVKYGMEVNPDDNRVEFVLDKLSKINDRYGLPYCPCLSPHSDNTICPCKNMREHQACRCGLYIRK